MAYDEPLAASVREILANMDGVSERKMFGGIAFLHHGNMVCGVIGETLMLRLGAELADAALDEPHTRPMDFTGRPMKGSLGQARTRVRRDTPAQAVNRSTSSMTSDDPQHVDRRRHLQACASGRPRAV